MYNTIEKALLYFLSKQDNTKIVQIGANDGVSYDPVYEVIRQFKDKTSILLVEPQNDIIPILKDNYAYHPNAFFSTDAVSDGQDKIFYSFKPEYYKYYYYEDSTTIVPEYAEPTGVASTNKQVFKKHYDLFFKNKNISFEESHTAQNISTITIKELLIRNPRFFDPDILIIDTEGDDDTLLYHNDWDSIKPKLIIFEKLHFESNQESKIINFLQKHHYFCIDAVEHIVAFLNNTH